MKPNLEAVLDRLEVLFTKPNKPNKRWEGKPPFWVVWTSPEVSLKPDETYSFRLYARAALISLLFVFALITLAYGSALVIGWPTFRKTYAFLHSPHLTLHSQHSAIILYGFIFLFAVVLPSLWAASVFAIPFPCYYFWNRRAKRLQSREATHNTVPSESIIDAALWPPAPKRPA